MKFRCWVLLVILIMGPDLGCVEYFPVQNRWLLIYLNAKRDSFSNDGLQPFFELRKDEKLVITVKVSPHIYEAGRGWRKRVEGYMRKLKPRLVKSVYSYASAEFLSIFDPKFDMMWRVVLGESLYGSMKNGRLEWKGGIY